MLKFFLIVLRQAAINQKFTYLLSSKLQEGENFHCGLLQLAED